MLPTLVFNFFSFSRLLRRIGQHTLVMEHVTPATRLLEKRRQMFDVQESLEQQKVEFNR